MGKGDVRARFEGVELPPYFQIVPPRRAHEARAAIGGRHPAHAVAGARLRWERS